MLFYGKTLFHSFQKDSIFPDSELRSAEELEESVNINEAFETSVAVGSHAFAKMEADVDRKRLSVLRKAKQHNPVDEEEYFRRVEHMHR